jgi:hypothetical protein
VPHAPSGAPEIAPLNLDELTAPPSEARVDQLFREEAARRLAPGDARTQPRTCEECGGLVPAGMSLCVCGFDLEVGRVSETLQVIAPESELPLLRPEISTGAFLIGWGSIALGAGLIVWGATLLGTSLVGGLFLFAGFAVLYSAILYLLGRSFKRLVLALFLAGFCDLSFLIIAPIIEATGAPSTATSSTEPTDSESHKGLIDRLDQNRLAAGTAGLFVIAFMLIYLSTSGGRRYVGERRAWEA